MKLQRDFARSAKSSLKALGLTGKRAKDILLTFEAEGKTEAEILEQIEYLKVWLSEVNVANQVIESGEATDEEAQPNTSEEPEERAELETLEPMSEDTASEDTASEDTASEDTASEDTASEDTASLPEVAPAKQGTAIILGKIQLPPGFLQPKPIEAGKPGVTFTAEDYLRGENPPSAENLGIAKSEPTAQPSAEDAEHRSWNPRPRGQSSFPERVQAEAKWVLENCEDLRENVFHCCAAGCDVHGLLDLTTDNGWPMFFVPNPDVVKATMIANPLNYIMCSKHRNLVNNHFDVMHGAVIRIKCGLGGDADIRKYVRERRTDARGHSVALSTYLAGVLDAYDCDSFELGDKCLSTNANLEASSDATSLAKSVGPKEDTIWLKERIKNVHEKSYICMHKDCTVKKPMQTTRKGVPYMYALSTGAQRWLNSVEGMYTLCFEHVYPYINAVRKRQGFSPDGMVFQDVRGIPLTEYLVTPFTQAEKTRHDFDCVFGDLPYDAFIDMVWNWEKE